MIGVVVSYGVLAGDAQGRVNLLFLLLLFAFLPVLGLILSLVLVLSGSGKGLAGWILELPILPRQLNSEILQLAISGSRKSWLFYQTQLLSLSFAAGSLLVFLLLLLGSDISFVWRSTLLEATDLLPVLNVMAVPWWFWSEAQPSLELLQQTQDFRLGVQSGDALVLGQWWKTIFAAQCTYNLLPRTLMLIISQRRYRRITRAGLASERLQPEPRRALNYVDDQRGSAPVVYSIASPYVLLDWANAPEFCRAHLHKVLGTPAEISVIAPLPPPVTENYPSTTASIVVLVKSWEPPLGELRDYLISLGGPQQKFVLPLDWDDRAVKPIREIHLHEWRRFCSSLQGWQLLQLDSEI